jgi:hypothetical protein
MKYEETICYNVDKCIEEMDNARKTGNLNGLDIVKRLHHIRSQAQKMENGLRRRKVIMEREHLEDEYQTLKGNEAKPTGINKIYNQSGEQVSEKTNIEVTIKRDGDTIYQNMAHAGVICVVEKIEDIDKRGQITGITQTYTFGNPMFIWFSFDRLKTDIEAKSMEILLSIQSAVKSKLFDSPEVIEKLKEVTNKLRLEEL